MTSDFSIRLQNVNMWMFWILLEHMTALIEYIDRWLILCMGFPLLPHASLHTAFLYSDGYRILSYLH